MMKTLISLIIKEFKLIFRDRWTIIILIGIPIVQISLFGFAITTEIRNINFAVIAPQRSEAVRHITERINANSYFTFTGYMNNARQIDDAFRKEKADVVLVFNGDIAHNAAANGNTSVQIVTDASNPNTAKSEAMYMSAILRDYFSLNTTIQGASSSVRTLYNPQLKSAYNFVPGIMGLLLMLICAMMTSISIVREKEVGTMELLLVSPTRPIFVIFAKMAPYFTLSIVNYITILLLSVFVLQIPITGSLLWLTVISLIYIYLALAVGLFISTIMATQVAAMIASLGILMFPTILLSGMLYPLENAALILQYLSCIFPARWYISAVRKIMIEGLPIHYVATEVSILIGMSVVMITLSLKKFKNRLE